jgi:hypothetical protein
LKQQALALSARMQSRDLSQANEEFNSFDKDMEQAAAGMQPAADKLKAMQWQDAMPIEQKVLQALLRAEATFRQIEVAFGQRGGGGGGGGGSAGRDLASLFDLEMDTEKNQYETAQTAASPAEQQQKKVDDALAKLDALAKRQEELAQKQGNQAQNFQERWQQEMLRREAEQLQRDMEQMQGQQGQQGQQSASNQQGQQGQSGQSGQQSQQGQSGQQGQQQAQGGQSGQAGQQGGRSGQASGSQSASRGSSGSPDGGADPRVTQALERLRAANESMAKAGSQQSAQQSQEEAKKAADRLREATDLLGGAQKQEASGALNSIGREADRLSKEESAEAERVRKLAAQGQAMQAKSSAGGSPSAEEMAAAERERESLANDRQGMSGDLEKLQREMRDTARELAPTQPGASSNLRDALSGMDQTDLTNLVQRTADWLRSGINPNSNGTETEIATGLKKLDDKVKQAQQAAGSGQNARGPGGQDAGTQTAELGQMDRLRSQIEGLASGRGTGSTGTPNGRNGQQGQQTQGQQQGRGQQSQGQQGQGQQQGLQRGQGQQGGGNQIAQGGRGGQGAQRGGQQNAPMGGEFVNGELRGGGGSTDANLNVDTGGQKYSATRNGAAPQVGPNPADTQRVIRQGVGELNQLRQMAKGDAAAQKQIDDIEKEMQKLDPSRFPGNPAMVEELHTKVLNDVDKLELQLQRDPNQPQVGQVRTAKPASVPAGYEDAVAEYYRRLGKGQ